MIVSVLLPATVKLVLLPEHISEPAGCVVTLTGAITVRTAAAEVAEGVHAPETIQRY